MKGRGRGRGGGAPSDLLVCFPSRAHLALMPKPICSPSRPGDASRRHLPMRTTTRGRSSPLARTEIVEPTSPKVNCAGQIKAGARTRPVDWFEELQRTRTRTKTRTTWLEVIGIKKREAAQFINAIRGIRLRMGCFGSFHSSTSDEEEDNEDEEEDEGVGSSSPSGAALSKWFMVLEEKHCHDSRPFEESAPPPNALMLMRCRSAPARGGWLEGDEAGEVTTAKMVKEGEKEKERLVLMSYAPDFFKVSTDVAKETWVVGMVDTLARSRSWKI